jgi:hypothetical protein
MFYSRHGERYLTEEEFERYCAELNIPLRKGANRDGKHLEGDLERFERHGILLPASLRIFPAEYTAAINEQGRDETMPPVLDDPKWKDMRPLELHTYTEPKDMTDDDLWHYLDRQHELGNPYLSKPDGQTFTSWESAPPGTSYGRTTSEDSTVRYYRYWQAYQAYLIQKHYRLFASYPHILKLCTDHAATDWERGSLERQWPKPTSLWLSFADGNSLFEPLSLYIRLRTQEARRSYARAETGEGYQSLSGAALKAYDARVTQHACTVQQRFALTEPQFVEFAVRLINFHDTLKKDERAKLASEVEGDLWYLREFMVLTSGKTGDELAEEVGRQGGFRGKKVFRYLDKIVEVTEEAVADWELFITDYNQAFPAPAQQITDVEIRRLVDFLMENGLFIVPFTVFDGGEDREEANDFYELRQYVGMKNLSTGLEDFLRVLYYLGLPTSQPPTVLPNGPRLLRSIIGAIFPWQGDFDRECARIENTTKRLGLDPVDEAIHNITSAQKDQTLDKLPHLRVFLIAYWTRNLTSHRHPSTNTLSHNLLYGQLGGRVFGAIFDCFFYAWTYAKQQGWVK